MRAIRLRLLGSLALVREDGTTSVDSVLNRPKQFAVLAYLAGSHHSATCPRDTLLALLWPELDGRHARKALRQSLYELRRALGPDVLTGKGMELVGVDRGRIWCDVRAFAVAVEEGRDEEALDLYGGTFLDGFHISGAPEFERWVAGQRRRLRTQACDAAWRLVEAADRAGDPAAARRWGERALNLAPYDEAGLRRYLTRMWELGQPAVAVRAFERYAEWLAEDLDLEPSAETHAIVARIRSGDPGGVAGRAPEPGPARDPAPEPASGASPSPGPPAGTPTEQGRDRSSGPARPLAVFAAVAALLVLAGLAPGLLDGWGSELEARRVVVIPLENRTGEASLDPVGRIAADWIVQGLAQTSVVAAVPSVLSLGALAQEDREPGDLEAHRARAVAHRLGAGTLVVGSYHRRADELEFQAQILDAGSGRLLAAVDGVRGDPSDPMPAIDELRRRTLGAVGFHFDTRVDSIMTSAHRPPSYEAYLAFATGLDHRERFEWRQSVASFRRAFALDTTFVPSLFMAALDYLNLREFARSDSLIRQLSASRERLSAVERLLLQWAEAQIRGDLFGALDAVERLAEYSNVFRPQVALDALRANRPRRAIEAYEDLPIDSFPEMWMLAAGRRLTDAYHRLGWYDDELRVARRGRQRHPDRREPLLWETRALIGLGHVGAARRTLEEALAMGSAGFWSPGELLLRVSDEFRAHGHEDDGRRLLPRALAWYRVLPDSLKALPAYRRHHAAALLRADSLDVAEAAFQRLAREFPDDLFYRGSLAVVLARRGEGVAARRIADALAHTPPYQFGHHWYERARVAAELGDTADAMMMLNQALARGYHLAFVGGIRSASASSPPAGSPHLDPAFAALRDHPGFRALEDGGG